MYLITVLTSFLQASRLNPRPLQVSRLWFVGILWLYRSLKAKQMTVWHFVVVSSRLKPQLLLRQDILWYWNKRELKSHSCLWIDFLPRIRQRCIQKQFETKISNFVSNPFKILSSNKSRKIGFYWWRQQFRFCCFCLSFKKGIWSLNKCCFCCCFLHLV